MAKLVVLTGAGLSAESGLRTFRDSNGLWENHSIDEVCNGATWRNNFELVHRFYNDRREQLGPAKPNAAHHTIAAWQKNYETVILTQNVDDLLERAGCVDVIHLHGKLSEMQCVDCGQVWDIGYSRWETGASCLGCKGISTVRPNIVFFGETAPFYEVMWDVLGSLRSRDAFVVIGTSGVVLPITYMARQFPGYKILNNLTEETAIDGAAFDEVLYQPATAAVEKIGTLLDRHFAA